MRTLANRRTLLAVTAVGLAGCMVEACGRTSLLSPTAGSRTADAAGSRTADAAASSVPPTGGATSQPPTGGVCPDGFTACGRGDAPLCYDLTRSPDHCGRCGNACAPGIACASSQCRQHRCQGPLSFKALPTVTTASENPNDFASFANYLPVLGDFDHDGILDFVGLPGPYAPMSLLLGAGDGAFRSRAIASDFSSYWMAATADLNGDGWLDLASIAKDQSAVTVRLGSADPASSFGPATPYPTGMAPLDWSTDYALLLVDLDEDGHVDLVTTGTGDTAEVGPRIGLWRGTASGALTPRGQIAVGATGSFLAAADWNRDGALDLVFGSSTLRTLMGRGDGTFDAEIACGLALAGHGANAIAANAIADFDQDRALDLVVRHAGLYFGMNGCNFTTYASVFDSAQPEPVAVADLDGDGNPDLVTSSQSTMDGQTLAYLGNGQGGFGAPLVFPSAGRQPGGGALLVGDLDHDSKLDLIVTRPDAWRVLLNTCP